jgi:hypothetical protein
MNWFFSATFCKAQKKMDFYEQVIGSDKKKWSEVSLKVS